MINSINWFQIGALIVFMLGLCAVGLYMKSRIKNSDDYWVGGRSVGPVTTAVSYCAAYASTVAIIGASSMYYRYGLGYGALAILGSVSFCGALSFVLIGLKMRAVSERTHAVSLPGLLAIRFESNAVRVICGFFVAVFTIPYGVAVLKAVANTLEVLAGVPYAWGVVFVSLTALIYMVSSGYWGVAATDLFQGILIVVGVWLVALLTLNAAGGVEPLMQGLQKADPALLTIPGPLPWGLFFSYSLVWALVVFGQPQLATKYMGLKDGRTMGAVIVVGVIWNIVFMLAVLILGLGAKVLLDPAQVSSFDKVAPLMVGYFKSDIVSALFNIGCAAAGMSSIAALYLTSSAAVTRDIYEDGIVKSSGRSLDAVKSISLSRVVTTVVILVTLALALKPWDVVYQISTTAAGAMGAAFTAPTFMGLYWKRATKAGCIAAMVSGAAVTVYWYMAKLGWAHPFVPGTIASFFFFIVVSYCTKVPAQNTINLFFKKGYNAE